MSVVEERVLAEVEETATRLVERFRRLRDENAELKQQLVELQRNLEVLERDYHGKCDQVKYLENDRKQTLSSVERMLKSLAALEVGGK